MKIKLVPIDKSNWKECVKLKVTEEQTHYVASNAYSVLQSVFETNLFPKPEFTPMMSWRDSSCTVMTPRMTLGTCAG